MKNRHFASSLMVVVFAIVALVVVGCNDINGGGWIKKSNGKKANFGFNFKCKGEGLGNAEASGQLQFNDHETGVKFHGVVDSVPENTCGGAAKALEGHYLGSYTPQPRKLGKGGRFVIYLAAKDKGESGPSKGDSFELSLTGGIYDGYSLHGTLEGGNIQAPGAEIVE